MTLPPSREFARDLSKEVSAEVISSKGATMNVQLLADSCLADCSTDLVFDFELVSHSLILTISFSSLPRCLQCKRRYLPLSSSVTKLVSRSPVLLLPLNMRECMAPVGTRSPTQNITPKGHCFNGDVVLCCRDSNVWWTTTAALVNLRRMLLPS